MIMLVFLFVILLCVLFPKPVVLVFNLLHLWKRKGGAFRHGRQMP